MRIQTMLAAFLMLGGVAGVAWPQTPSGPPWPTRQPIKLILPFPAGSSLDTIGRPVFEQVGTQLGQSFVFESKPGAGGTLGMAQAAKADPDGYTFLLNSSIQTVVQSTFAKLPFDTLRDFVGVIPLGQFPNVMVAPPGRFASVQDLVARAKAKPDSITYGSGGIGAATHLNAERFRLAAGFKAVHVPFKGAPEAVREVLGGRIDFYFSPLPSVVQLIRAGQLDALAISGLKRDASLPDVPTTLEAGYTNSDYVFWLGVFAPAATPKEIVQRLYQETARTLAEPAMAERIRQLGADPIPMTPAELDAYVRAELESNAKLIKAAGIEPN
ncbi:MAG: tripartite tricarboxylate transporter substrate binding protein [Hyphomicrobiales bacterium]|nr:tripartite tricarboxylate transporter substrate binding protein [Hyphomicrobiales bacterium]